MTLFNRTSTPPMARPSNGPSAGRFRTVFPLVKRKSPRILCSLRRIPMIGPKSGRALARIQSKRKVSQVFARLPPGGRFRTMQNLRKQSRAAALSQALRECVSGASGRTNRFRGLSVQSHDGDDPGRLCKPCAQICRVVFNFDVTGNRRPSLRCRRDSIKSDSHFMTARIVQPRDVLQRSRMRAAICEFCQEIFALVI